MGAARAEPAPAGRIGRVGGLADHLDRAPVVPTHGIGHRHRGQQRFGVGMPRSIEDGVPIPDLDDPTEVHHGDPVGEMANDCEVVADEHERDPELGPEPLQELKDLRLDRHVQRRHRLVEDDQLGVEREGPGDADALALAPGEGARTAVGVGGIETDEPEQLVDPRRPLGPGPDAVDLERLGDDLPDPHARVQGAVRILEHDAYVAPEAPEVGTARPGDVLTVEVDRPARRPDQSDEGSGERRLAAPRLADEAERLPTVDHEVDTVDGAHHTIAGLEVDGEVVDLEQGRHETEVGELTGDPPSTSWHATRRRPIESSSGADCPHRPAPSAHGQRGSNAQPEGGRDGSGG